MISSFEADKFGAWEASKFAPEKAFLEEIEKIPGKFVSISWRVTSQLCCI